MFTFSRAFRCLGICLLGLSFGRLAAQSFTEVSQSAGIVQYTYNPIQMGAGVAWFDYDADGDEDLYFTGAEGPNKLYRNEGNGTFTDVTAASGLDLPPGFRAQGVVTGDIDNDGYREVFIGTEWHKRNFLFRNNGDGTFTDITASAGMIQDSSWVSSATFGDVNLDGLLDLYTAGYVRIGALLYDTIGNPIGYAHRCSENMLWINNGNGTFTNQAGTYAVADTGCALSVLFTDFDRDHDADLLVANDFGEWVYPSSLYQNAYPAPFVDVSVSAAMNAQMYGMGIAVGDYDHDLDLDYYVTNIGWNALFNNDGNGGFAEVGMVSGVRNDSVNGKMTTGWGDAWIDYDLDGWQDLFVANGYIELIPLFQNERNDPNKLFRNNGDGTFADVSAAAGIANVSSCRGAGMADYDQDGDADLAVGVIRIDSNSSNHSLLFRNDQNTGHHFLSVRVQGTVNNRDGFGTQLVIHANGTEWVHEVSGGSSHMSQHSSIANFGLGNALSVDSLFVIWPDGNVQLLENIPADTFITVVEDPNQYLGLRPRDGFAAAIELVAVPNPSQGVTYLQLGVPVDLEGELLIVDGVGRKVFHKSTSWYSRGNHRIEWNGAKNAAGVYQVIFQGEGFRRTLRLLRL